MRYQKQVRKVSRWETVPCGKSKLEQREEGSPSETKRGQEDIFMVGWLIWELRPMVSEKGIHAEWQPRIGSQTPSKKKRVSIHGWRWGWKSKVGYIQDDQIGECLRIIRASFLTQENNNNAKEENLNSMRISKQVIRNMEKKKPKTACNQFWRKQYAPGKVDVRQMHKRSHELLIQKLKTYDYNKDKYSKKVCDILFTFSVVSNSL